MAITRLDPFREFATLQDRMNRLFGDIYLRDEDVSIRPSWVPPVDIYETEGHDLVIKAELPDLGREEIDVTVENNTLTIRGERKLPAEVKEDQFRRVERHYGTFSRSFTLPNTVDASKVSADYKNGVLTVKLPFRDEAKPRTVTVDVAA
jgi:HSP20 family protein